MTADALRRLPGLRLRGEDGNEEILKLQPPATEGGIRTLEARLPCPIPDDIRDALRVSKGLANEALESFSLVDLEGFGLEECQGSFRVCSKKAAGPCAFSLQVFRPDRVADSPVAVDRQNAWRSLAAPRMHAWLRGSLSSQAWPNA